MGEGPIPASKLALKKAGLSLEQMDVIESNEALPHRPLRWHAGWAWIWKRPIRMVEPGSGSPGRLLRCLYCHQSAVRTATH
ncbi:MAG: hypothetical protein R3E89_11495 [Thiolinea sp.]